jgi:hypothetical protein
LVGRTNERICKDSTAKKDFIQPELATTCVMILKYISDGRIIKNA